MSAAYIYLLHFDEPFHHARHYAGCTQNLKARLIRHANGHGGNIVKHALLNRIQWRLGALALTTKSHMRKLERDLKKRASGPDFCTICNPERTKRIPGTQPIDPDILRFAARSDALFTGQPANANIRFTGPGEPRETFLWIKHMMRKDKDALGFIPAGGDQGLSLIYERGQIAIVSENDQPVGYACYTMPPAEMLLRIQQCVVADDARFCGFGRQLVDAIAARHPARDLIAKVRSDLAANHFWNAIGFNQIGSFQHKTSGSTINEYTRLCQDAKLI